MLAIGRVPGKSGDPLKIGHKKKEDEMRKGILLILLLGAVAMIITGCTQAQANQNQNQDEAVFEQITADEITDSDIAGWFAEKYMEYGVHQKADGDGEYTYVLVSSGMKPTGGYSMSIEKTGENSETVTFTVSLEAPGENDMVTQVITYPSALMKVKAGDRNIVVDGLEGIEELDDELEVNDKLFVEGLYTGRIDANFIEVAVNGDSMVFLYPLEREKDEFQDGITGDGIVGIEYTVDGDGQKSVVSIAQSGDRIVKLEINGVYTGRHDNNFIEVESEDEPVVFKYRLEKQIEELGESFAENTPVTIEYYVDGNGQKQVVAVSRQEEADGETKTLTGTYTGRHDSNFIEVESEGQYLVFKYRYEKQTEQFGESLDENTRVDICYYEDDNGQNQVVSIEKTQK